MSDQSILLFGIGAQKAATTWLFAQVEAQPGTYLARPKELHYWDCVRPPFLEQFRYNVGARMGAPGEDASLRYRLSSLLRPQLRRNMAAAQAYRNIFKGGPFDHSRYLAYLRGAGPAPRLFGDITLSYALLDRSTFAEMAACHPNTRFVFLMRDPVDRLWSGIKQRWRGDINGGRVSPAQLETLFTATLDNPESPDLRRSQYSKTIAELEAALPADQIFYSFFETLLDPDLGAADRSRLEAFLDMPKDCLNPSQQVHGGARKDTPPPELAAHARQVLAPEYRFAAQTFGDAVPAAWST